ncbi:GAF domain-containing protein [Xylophilus sp. Kf1]|nr:GAF domain-containing protein [Xylophilus sp. Kf1]
MRDFAALQGQCQPEASLPGRPSPPPTPTPPMPTTAATTADSFQAFRSAFDTQGLRSALATLLRLTDYRFIGIWRFDQGRAAAAAHFDREMPDRQQAAEVPESATYCTIVRDSGEPFATADAMADRRLDRHPAREEVRTYCGIPLMGSDGAVMGTLCHYDLVPRDPEQINVELMLMVGSFLALNGHVPPYPHDRSPAEAPA